MSIAPRKGIDPWRAYLMPFSKYVWIFFVLSILGAGTILYLLRKLSAKNDQQIIFSDSFWEIIVISCWDSIKIQNPSWPVFIHLSCYMMTYQILISLYFGDYAAAVIVPKFLSPPINSFEQLSETDMTWVSVYDFDTEYWQESLSGFGDLPDRYVFFIRRRIDLIMS